MCATYFELTYPVV